MPLFARLDASLLASDGFHPGPLAHAKWGAAAAERIRKAFEKSPRDDCA